MLKRFTLPLLLGFFGACGPGANQDADDPDIDVDASSLTPASEEVCDQVDNDQDGQIDEICSCSSGSQQACWPGDPAQRNRGVCHDGLQACGADPEFSGWGACEGAAMPNGESGPACQNAIDDDCDGLIDCEDPSCSSVPACCEHKCKAGTVRLCDEPEFCLWGTQTCGPDGAWSTCIEADPPAGCTGFPFGFGYDEDCCVDHGYCCENSQHESVGSCPPEQSVCPVP